MAAEILVLRNEIPLEDAKDLLWRRETRNEGTGKTYPAGTLSNSIIIGHLQDFQGLDHVLYTDFDSAGKVARPNLADLIAKAIVSVRKAELGKDGISYLIHALEARIQTPLTDQYVSGLLHRSGAGSLKQALGWLQAGRFSEQTKRALRRKPGVSANSDGYVPWPQDNLLPGVRLEQFEHDLRRGAGSELRMKFCAVHSSCALAVNAFAPFKDRPGDLVLSGQSGFGPPSFEHELPTNLSGTPPTLDVFLRRGSEATGIESKFLEYATAKEAEFTVSYTRAALPWAEDCWWQVVETSKRAGGRHLDVAQLVKHYFGISRLLARGDETGWKPTQAALVYLFWEPSNATHIEACRQHRDEIESLASQVSGSKVLFRWLSYPELWQEWSQIPALAAHARNLIDRYAVQVV